MNLERQHRLASLLLSTALLLAACGASETSRGENTLYDLVSEVNGGVLYLITEKLTGGLGSSAT